MNIQPEWIYIRKYEIYTANGRGAHMLLLGVAIFVSVFCHSHILTTYFIAKVPGAATNRWY